MKKSLPFIAAAALVALALAGCSAGATGGGAGAQPPQGGSSSQNYGADDLVKILQTAEKTIGTGTISDNATILAKLKAAGPISATAGLTADGGKIVPASCGTTLDQAVTTDGKDYGVGPKGIAAELNYDKGLLTLVSVTSGSLPTGLSNKITATLQSLYSACSSAQAIDSGVTVGLTIKKLALHTNADETYGYEETISASGTSTASPEVEAISGNLLIVDVGIDGTDADAAAAVNAVLAAAK
ncbi:MAG: hypothetical protein WDM88_01315 [Galbitalea sp.]